MINIISRSAWGAQPWVNTPDSVPFSERTEFYIHYDGATPVTRTGYSIPRQIESEHLNNGWSGIGYHFVVSQAGEIFEGRGWNLQGAHCPNHNRSAFGVQIAIGGHQEPTAAALKAARDLYEVASSKVGRALYMHGHKDGFATDCPGDLLYPWVQDGMPYPDETSPCPPDGSPAPYRGPLWSRVLRLTVPRMYGTDVEQVQWRLHEIGWSLPNSVRYWSGIQPRYDGIFGPELDGVIRRYQAEKGLVADGEIGEKTRYALWNISTP